MTGSLTHSQADILRYLIIDLGYATMPEDGAAWPVYSHRLPDAPDSCLCVFDTTGLKHGRAQLTGEVQEHPGVQIKTRSANGSLGRNKAHEIMIALDAVLRKQVSIGSSAYLVHSISRGGDVVPLGEEPSSKRKLFTLNVTASLRQLS